MLFIPDNYECLTNVIDKNRIRQGGIRGYFAKKMIFRDSEWKKQVFVYKDKPLFQTTGASIDALLLIIYHKI